MKVFLGGTCGNSTWRSELMPQLDSSIDAYNPVVPNWTEECQKIEDDHKENDDIVLFVITPETKSPYSISEITRFSIVCPERTVVCVLPEANGMVFEAHEAKAWDKILKDISQDGTTVCANLEEVAKHLNTLSLSKQNQPGQI